MSIFIAIVGRSLYRWKETSCNRDMVVQKDDKWANGICEQTKKLQDKWKENWYLEPERDEIYWTYEKRWLGKYLNSQEVMKAREAEWNIK